MREIKFRAWLIDDKYIVDVEAINFYKDAIRYFDPFDGGSPKDLYFKYKLMQWTGLKDKNSKDIYERDIFKSDNHNGKLFEITWIDLGWGLHNPDDVGLHFVGNPKRGSVVGNIYENHELLEDGKIENKKM